MQPCKIRNDTNISEWFAISIQRFIWRIIITSINDKTSKFIRHKNWLWVCLCWVLLLITRVSPYPSIFSLIASLTPGWGMPVFWRLLLLLCGWSLLMQTVHPPLFVNVRRSSNFCEMVVNFYAVSSKRGRFTKAPSLKTSWFPCRGPRVSTIRFLFQLQYFDFLFGEVKQPI